MSDIASPNSKIKLLFLSNYLMEHTDELHPVTLETLIELYKQNGFKGNRNTIPNDIEALQEAGVDIITDHRGKFKVYYIGNRLFEVAEVRTLIDAVSSSRFITATKSKLLIQKLTKLTSEFSRAYLEHSAFAVDRIKTMSKGIFNTIDKVNDAIRLRKKISFQYIDYTPEKRVIRRHNGKRYIVSPQAFIWNDDRYYVPSYSDEKGCIVPFRVDRMRDVEMLDEDAFIVKKFNPSEYSRKALKMYGGNVPEQEVVLEADNNHMLSIVDRFGTDIETKVVSNTAFQAKVTVCPSSTFFAWVFQFSGGIRIAAPERVRDDYRRHIMIALGAQEIVHDFVENVSDIGDECVDPETDGGDSTDMAKDKSTEESSISLSFETALNDFPQDN